MTKHLIHTSISCTREPATSACRSFCVPEMALTDKNPSTSDKNIAPSRQEPPNEDTGIPNLAFQPDSVHYSNDQSTGHNNNKSQNDDESNRKSKYNWKQFLPCAPRYMYMIDLYYFRQFNSSNTTYMI